MKDKLKDYLLKINNFLNKDFCKKTTKQLNKINWEDHYFKEYGKPLKKRSGDRELEVSFDSVINKKEIMDRLYSAIQTYQDRLKFPWYSSWAGYTEIRFNKYTKDKVMANKPALSNSLLTLGPTFSTLLKFTSDPRSEDNLSLINFIKSSSLDLRVSILTK